MKPPFVMSKYASLQDLLADKASYWERIATEALERLMELEEVRYDHYGDPYWTASGQMMGESE